MLNTYVLYITFYFKRTTNPDSHVLAKLQHYSVDYKIGKLCQYKKYYWV